MSFGDEPIPEGYNCKIRDSIDKLEIALKKLKERSEDNTTSRLEIANILGDISHFSAIARFALYSSEELNDKDNAKPYYISK